MFAALALVFAAPGLALAVAQTEPIPTFIARLHGGTCDTWAPSAYAHHDATPAAPGPGPTTAEGAPIPAASVSTTVDVKFEDVGTQPHAVVVYRGTTESPDILACGDVAGSQQGDTLLIGVREAGGSGYAGVAELRRHGIIRDQTELTVYLVPARALLGAGDAAATPEPVVSGGTEAATPASPSPAARSPEAATPPTGMTVDLVDFRFIPSSFSIPANTPVTITLTNTGQALHNFSIDALRISQDVPSGDTRLVTINAPAGTYEFYCDEPGHKAIGMVGTLTVG